MAEEFQDTTIVDESSTNPGADVDMTEGGEAAGTENANGSELPFADTDIVDPRISFATYLTTPIVTLLVGAENPSILTAHQGLLTKSPYFAEACKDFDDVSVNIYLASRVCS